MSLDSLKQRLAAGDFADREFVDLKGALASAFHIGHEPIAHRRPPAIGVSVVDVNELLAQIEGVLAGVLGHDVQTTLELDAVDSLVEAESAQLEWAFLNLAANSREAMPNGGVFSVRTTSFDRLVGASSRTQRVVRITVTDTGPGLFGEARVSAFGPSFSAKEGAARLGLASVAMIVRTFQGWLRLDSSDAGTSIHIHLPVLTTAGR